MLPVSENEQAIADAQPLIEIRVIQGAASGRWYAVIPGGDLDARGWTKGQAVARLLAKIKREASRG